MKLLSLILSVFGLLISFVQAYRPTQTLDDLMIRDIVDELELRYQSARAPHYDVPRGSLSRREQLLDALALRYLDTISDYDHPLRRRLVDSNDYLTPREVATKVEITVGPADSPNNKLTVEAYSSTNIWDLKQKLASHKNYKGKGQGEIQLYDGVQALPLDNDETVGRLGAAPKLITFPPPPPKKS